MSNEKIKVEVIGTGLLEKITNASERFIVNIGGAGSSKTHSLLQYFILERITKFYNYKLLILRKTRHSNKLSIYKAFIDLLKEYNIYSEASENKSDLVYTIQGLNNYVRFAGLDDREKIKSTEWHDIAVEEASEFQDEDFSFLKTRLYRGDKVFLKPRMYFNLNPVDCWIFKYEGAKDFRWIWSNYKDNPFANKDYIEVLEGLKEQDEAYYNIYALGRRGVLKDIIYKPYKIISLSEYPDKFDDECYGVDFGYNMPSVLLHIGYKDKARYLREKIYQTHLTRSEFVCKIKTEIPADRQGSVDIYADSEDPAGIQEIYDAGFYGVKPALKGKGSVKAGIDFCKRQEYISCPENININKERDVYKYKQDKSGNVIDEPVKFKDHAMDAKRYADYTHSNKQELRIL